MRHRSHPTAPPEGPPRRLVPRGRVAALTVGLVVFIGGSTVVTAAAAGAAEPIVTAPEAAAPYTLVRSGTGKALDVPGWSTADGTQLTQYARTGGANQQFRFVPAGGGFYRVQSVSSGKVLDDKSYSTAEGAPVIQSADHNGVNQHWRIVPSGPGVQLVNRHSGKVLDVAGSADGAPATQRTDRDTATQQWSLVKVGAANTPVTPPPAPAPAPTPTPGTGSGQPLWVNPDNPAAKQVAAWRTSGRGADAQILDRIATRPMASWVVGGTATSAQSSVDGTADRAQAARARAVFVAYNIPNRDCGSFSAGGASGVAQYDQWVAGFATGLGGRNAVVVLEPDAVPQQMGGCTPGNDRYAALARAVDKLEAAGADVYIDAGHPGWIRDFDALAAALTSAGVKRAAGFSLNVSNFTPTAEDIAYGKQISAKLGGAHFVIDTSRNGAVNPPAVTSGPSWCNPPGRKIGPAPTTNTGDRLVDAYLWIKTPGESDGSCRSGEPNAGGWMPEYALSLAR